MNMAGLPSMLSKRPWSLPPGPLPAVKVRAIKGVRALLPASSPESMTVTKSLSVFRPRSTKT